MSWTPERDAALKGHIDKGLSSSQSAAILQITPSAVIGRAYRLGWRFHSGQGGSRRSARRERSRPEREEAQQAFKPLAPLRTPPASGSARPWLTRRASECAFPVDGEGVDLRSCCAPCGEETYCPPHHRFMRRPTSSLEDFAASLKSLVR